MKYWLGMLVACMMISLSAYAEEHKEFYPSGPLRYVQPIENGKAHGQSIVYYEDGSVMQEVMFLSGQKHGYAREYFPNGQERYVYFYQKGQLEGESVQYYENGQVHVRVFHKNNLRTGPYREYNAEGQLTAVYEYVKGVWHGPAVEYLPSGKILRQMTFVMGEVTGVLEEFWPNGLLKYRMNYIKGVKQGVSEMYNEQGVLVTNRFFVDGDARFEEYLSENIPMKSLQDDHDSYQDRLIMYKDLKQEQKDWSETLRDDVTREDVYFQRGMVLLKLAYVDDALDDLSRAIEIDPNFAPAYAVRACVYRLLGNVHLAEKDFIQAEQLGYNTQEWRQKISLAQLSPLF